MLREVTVFLGDPVKFRKPRPRTGKVHYVLINPWVPINATPLNLWMLGSEQQDHSHCRGAEPLVDYVHQFSQRTERDDVMMQRKPWGRGKHGLSRL